jgi:hypothetical protein
MHIHVPKPLHGWRAFMGEVGVIVLGVLIALALGQLVETIHENRIADEARNSVKAEVRENLFWIEQREQREACIRQRLAELGDLLVRVRRGDSVPVVQHLGLLGHGKITSLRWQANAQAGRASLFSGDEQRRLGNMYFTTEQFRDAQEQETVAWSKLRFIQGLQQWTPLDVHDFSIFLAEARYENWVIVLTMHRAHQWAERMHLTAANSADVVANFAKPSEAQICQPLTAPLVSSPDVTGVGAFAAPDDTP